MQSPSEEWENRARGFSGDYGGRAEPLNSCFCERFVKLWLRFSRREDETCRMCSQSKRSISFMKR
jgi:hypothetical protein